MRSLVFACLFAVAFAQLQDYKNARITEYSNELDFPYNYRFLYKSDDGQQREEIGETENQGRPDESAVVRGIYSYIGPDGITYTVAYIADKDGFRPEGEHLPPAASVKKSKPLGIPSAALASLAG